MIWTPEKLKSLEDDYNKGLTDKELAIRHGGNPVSISKVRSRNGFVRYNRIIIAKRKATQSKPKLQIEGLICAYLSDDNKRHLFYLKNHSIESAENAAQNIMKNNFVKEIVIYSPMKKVFLQRKK